MQLEDIPDNVDVVVVGTGLTESIVAAACARVGKSVLHLDNNDFYGTQWASFGFEQFVKWTNSPEELEEEDEGEEEEVGESGEPAVKRKEAVDPFKQKWGRKFDAVANIEEICYVLQTTSPDDPDPPEWTLDKIKAQTRKFNIDLCPRVIYSRGPMVDLLVQSNICRYLEFKCVSRMLSYKPTTAKLIEVPCSRADIFNSKSISIVQKRMLMKFMNFCLDLEKQASDLQDFDGMSFVELLRSKGLDKELEEFLINCIVMSDDTVSAIEALEALKKFTSSVGRFGNTPFLWPLYGNGELPQAFCRLCAVFGGTYCLNQAISAIKVDGDTRRVSHIIANEQAIACKQMVVGLANLPRELLTVQNESEHRRVSRATFITTKSLCPAGEKDEVTMIRIPAHDDLTGSVTLLELGHSSLVVPKGLYVVYAWSSGRGRAGVESSAKRDLMPVAKKLFSLDGKSAPGADERPQLLWCCYYDQIAVSDLSCKVSGIHVTNSPVDEVDYEKVVSEARRIFSAICPDEEFLPRAPDAEDIVIESQEQSSSSNGHDNERQQPPPPPQEPQAPPAQ